MMTAINKLKTSIVEFNFPVYCGIRQYEAACKRAASGLETFVPLNEKESTQLRQKIVEGEFRTTAHAVLGMAQTGVKALGLVTGLMLTTAAASVLLRVEPETGMAALNGVRLFSEIFLAGAMMWPMVTPPYSGGNRYMKAVEARSGLAREILASGIRPRSVVKGLLKKRVDSQPS